jgi:ribonuclease HII
MLKHKTLKDFDDSLRAKYGQIIAGVDEVGRGSWAGPMVAGCVILPSDVEFPGLNDSKKLTAAQRNELDLLIREKSLVIGIGIVDSDYVDSKGLTAANIRCMSEACKNLIPRPELEVVPTIDVFAVDQSPYFDGNPHVMMPKGDSTSLSIAAASVVAKVFRDRLMANMDEVYPGYGFAGHKGYINDVHLEAVRKLGLTLIHRKSYKVKGFETQKQITLLDLI